MPSRPLNARPARATLFLLLCLLLGVSACGTVQPVRPTINLPQSFRAECSRPDPTGVITVGDLASFSLRQDAAISECNSVRDKLVGIIDKQNPPRKKRFGLF